MFIQTTLDLLYLALALSVLGISSILMLLLLRVYSILFHIQSIVTFVKNTADIIHSMAWKPMEVLFYLIEYIRNESKK